MGKRVLLCTPLALKSVPTKTYTSIDRAKEYVMNNLHKLPFDLEAIGTYAPATFPIDANRNQIVAYAIENDFDYTIWFDMDQTFEEDMIFKLIMHMKDHEVVTGMYYAKESPHHPIIFNSTDEEFKLFTPLVIYPGNKLFYADMIGMGCVAINTDVFRKIEQPYFKYQRHPASTVDPLSEMKNRNNVNDVSEDVWFCKQLKDNDIKIVVDPTIQCGHITELVVTQGLFQGFFQGQKQEYLQKFGKEKLREKINALPKPRLIDAQSEERELAEAEPGYMY